MAPTAPLLYSLILPLAGGEEGLQPTGEGKNYKEPNKLLYILLHLLPTVNGITVLLLPEQF